MSLAAAVFVSGPAWAQGTTFTPASGQAMTILFEDLWPSEGDYDFNDVVLSANVRREENVGGQTTEIVYHLGVTAMGASQCAGLALRIPGVDPANITTTRKIGTAGASDGEPWQSGGVTAVTDGAGGSVIPLSGNLRSNLCGGAAGFINTVPGSATTACSPLAVRLQFSAPLAAPPPAPGDVFIFRCGDTGHQIHGPATYGVPGGTYAVDKTMYRTFDDLSETDFNGDPIGTTFYVNDVGISWKLELSDQIANFPAENQRIDAVLPDILDFAAGNTTLAWWHTPAGNDFEFQGSPPPFPFTTFFDSVEEGLCAADPIGEWVNDACDCSAQPFHVWNGVTCEESEQARCDADPYGAWVAGACDCGPLSWNGTSCYDATDPQAMACANGGTTYSGAQIIPGGGEWANGTCDCTPAGVGYYWNGYGCYDPSFGQEALCVAAGGDWTPWENGFFWNPYEANSTCDCSSYGPGFYWTGSGCTDGSGGTADDCEADGGRWSYGSLTCDCRDLGYGWIWDGTQCAPSVAEQACIDASGAWTGSVCDCPNGDQWTGDPNNLSMGGSCTGGEDEACWYWGGNWTGSACDCSTTNSGWTWDPELWRCLDPSVAEVDCIAANGTWTGTTCDCEFNFGPGYVWDGYQMCNPTDPVVQACEMEMGTWVPWTSFYPTWAGPMPMYGSGTCDCPPGEMWTWGAMYGQCTPYAEFECWNAGAAMWNGMSCDCGMGSNPSRTHAVWDGETCAPSIEREVCEMTEMSMWNTWSNTCDCNGSPGCPGCAGVATWDPIDLECESPERECYRSGGSWDSMSMTCNCNMGGTMYAAWDGQHCVYSGERHACESAGSMWVTQPGMVWDPDTSMWNSEPTCDCTYYEGYWSSSNYWNGWTYVSDMAWDDQRLECVDLTGRYTCEHELGKMWMTDPMYPGYGSCDCAYMWDPENNTYEHGRWNPTTFECVPDAEVEACINDGGWWSFNTMGMGTEGCYCDTATHGWSAMWYWDGTTGECTSPEEEGCEATGGNWSGTSCDCWVVGPNHVFQQDPMTWEWECANPQQESCEQGYPGSTWDPMYNSCDCAGAGPYHSWDGGNQCYPNPEKEACINQGANWRTDSGPPGWCECPGGTWQYTGMMNPYDWECVP